jgi:uncharacterized protein YqgV (UPF0045/DUF77 family)
MTMTTTIELSFYPFHETYRDLIQEFIRKLDEYQDVQITAGPTSSVIVGDHDSVMNCLNETMKWSCVSHGKSVFVAKILLDYNP